MTSQEKAQYLIAQLIWDRFMPDFDAANQTANKIVLELERRGLLKC